MVQLRRKNSTLIIQIGALSTVCKEVFYADELIGDAAEAITVGFTAVYA